MGVGAVPPSWCRRATRPGRCRNRCSPAPCRSSQARRRPPVVVAGSVAVVVASVVGGLRRCGIGRGRARVGGRRARGDDGCDLVTGRRREGGSREEERSEEDGHPQAPARRARRLGRSARARPDLNQSGAFGLAEARGPEDESVVLEPAFGLRPGSFRSLPCARGPALALLPARGPPPFPHLRLPLFNIGSGHVSLRRG